mgnify:CR=1 FL=1
MVETFYLYDTEGSLVAVEPIIQKLRNKIQQVDAEILAAVRQQVISSFLNDFIISIKNIYSCYGILL